MAVIVGIVIGSGIFKTPSLVAANVETEMGFLLIWLWGAGLSLLGAFCYVELGSAYPHAGGEYYYLKRAFGNALAWLFAWGRLSVIQTGSIALLAFVFGDYVSQLFWLGDYSSSIYAALVVTLLSALNLLGTQPSKWTQNCLSAAKILGLLLVIGAGLFAPSPESPLTSPTQPPHGSYGLAMIFVLLTYGGWSEAAYLSAELSDVQRNLTRVLIGSLSLLAVLFVLLNFAYLKGLGLTALAESEVVAADLMRLVFGERGAQFISCLIAVSVLGATNGTILTGARTIYALGQDYSGFSFLGQWNQRTQTASNALLVQGAIALALVLLGTLTRTGFVSMVEYSAPVFWFFLLLSGLSLLILRHKEPDVPRPFLVPFYPLTPLLFCATCLYMLQASLIDTGIGALVGLAVLLAGIPLLLVVHPKKV